MRTSAVIRGIDGRTVLINSDAVLLEIPEDITIADLVSDDVTTLTEVSVYGLREGSRVGLIRKDNGVVINSEDDLRLKDSDYRMAREKVFDYAFGGEYEYEVTRFSVDLWKALAECPAFSLLSGYSKDDLEDKIFGRGDDFTDQEYSTATYFLAGKISSLVGQRNGYASEDSLRAVISQWLRSDTMGPGGSGRWENVFRTLSSKVSTRFDDYLTVNAGDSKPDLELARDLVNGRLISLGKSISKVSEEQVMIMDVESVTFYNYFPGKRKVRDRKEKGRLAARHSPVYQVLTEKRLRTGETGLIENITTQPSVCQLVEDFDVILSALTEVYTRAFVKMGDGDEKDFFPYSLLLDLALWNKRIEVPEFHSSTPRIVVDPDSNLVFGNAPSLGDGEKCIYFNYFGKSRRNAYVNFTRQYERIARSVGLTGKAKSTVRNAIGALRSILSNPAFPSGFNGGYVLSIHSSRDSNPQASENIERYLQQYEQLAEEHNLDCGRRLHVLPLARHDPASYVIPRLDLRRGNRPEGFSSSSNTFFSRGAVRGVLNRYDLLDLERFIHKNNYKPLGVVELREARSA